MSLFRHREARQWTPEPLIPPFPGMDSIGGGSPSMQSSLRISSVWACVRLLSDAVSMMPLHQYRLEAPEGGIIDQAAARIPVPDAPFLTQPGGDASMPDWLYMLMVSLLLRGNAYGIKQMNSRGVVTQVDLLNPDDVQVTTDVNSGRVTFSLCGEPIHPTQLWRMSAYRLPGFKTGLSPIAYAAATINTDAEISKFALGYFKDAPHPPAILTTDQSIKQEDARSIKDRILQNIGKREPLVLGAGLKYQNLSVSPEESQFLATQKWNVATIARVFGVPPEMIASESGGSLTYSNTEQRALDFLTYSVQPWLTRIEAALAPLFPGTQHPRFDTSILLRTDLETRLRAGAIAIASKVNTPDEVRSWSDQPPLTDEQKKILELVPLTVTPTGRPQNAGLTNPDIADFSSSQDGSQGGSDATTA